MTTIKVKKLDGRKATDGKSLLTSLNGIAEKPRSQTAQTATPT